MKIRNFARAAGFAASMALMLGGLAQATETDGNLPVSADISNTCSFGTINDLAFSTYDPVVTNASTDLTTSSTFGLTCTSGASITIGLSLGANAVTTQRYMIDGGTDVLSYNLFQNSNHSTAWNLTSTETDTGAEAVDFTIAGGQ